MNMLQIFNIKCILNLRIYIETGKKFRFGGVKMVKSNKVDKTEYPIGEYHEEESVFSIGQTYGKWP